MTTPLQSSSITPLNQQQASRRAFLTIPAAANAALTILSTTASPRPANAVGPVRVDLKPITYSAQVCPPSKPIPGEKAMKGMRGLCVNVKAKLAEPVPKDLEKVGVYGFVTDGVTGDSVLANNPDLSTDAGQFCIIEKVTTADKTVEFEFVAAVPMEKDLTKFDNGIGELSFNSLRVVSFPGGQQYGEVTPCEMNEFSQECEDWEAENGPYEKKEFMVKSNPRTKGR
eukprot:CAMPEP_0172490964 /NCGR_PEP_ID=MMETSP1066-20121228/21604_1 /TAXON_ID=671091 /ORGANISM="Coscinodiscus wailesii, Strain CCMP2513" /LENGTH=226 /DNA_ID=CAMNT_0013259723 /DNA_START=201 /DNA_END=881 /DNA_ORIENTATION=+